MPQKYVIKIFERRLGDSLWSGPHRINISASFRNFVLLDTRIRKEDKIFAHKHIWNKY